MEMSFYTRTLLCIAVGLSSAAQTSIGAPRMVSFVTREVEFPATGDVSVLDSHHLWVGLAYTADGGRSWVGRLPTKATNQRLFDIPETFGRTFFKTRNRGWLNGNADVWTTRDGGRTWTRLFRGRGFSTAGFSNDKRGWMAVGNDHVIRNYITRDRGETWSVCGSAWPEADGFPNGSVSFVDNETAWVTLGKYDEYERTIFWGVARTDDGGCNWKTIWRDTNHIGGQIGEVQFLNHDLGFLLPGNWGSLLRTTDGGGHWETVSGGYHMEGGFFTSPTDGWALGNPSGGKTDSGMSHTSDGGKTWQPVPAMEIRENRGLARQIPEAWGPGFFRKLAVTYSWSDETR
jgi:photosystem II stability/assembly factor-like uncharacterized protein